MFGEVRSGPQQALTPGHHNLKNSEGLHSLSVSVDFELG